MSKDGKESDAFLYTKGKHDFQYSSFSTGVNTKSISGLYTPDHHSMEDLFHCGRIRLNTIFPSKDKCNIPCQRCEIMEIDAVQIHG